MSRIETYNRVYAEQTDEDRARYTEQCKMVSEYKKYVEDNDVPKIGIAKKMRAPVPEIPAEAVVIPSAAADTADGVFAGIDWAAAGFRDQ